jgi:hypothetical protein
MSTATQIWPDAKKIEIVVDKNIENPSYTQVLDCRKVFRGVQSQNLKEKKEQIVSHVQGKEEFSSRFDLSHFVV